MPKVNGQSVTRLAGQPCANPSCNRKITSRCTHLLCWGCDAHQRRYVLPVAGFIASGDLRFVAKTLLQEINPTSSEIAEALRMVRGTRHREGEWSERPAYRLQPLLHGRLKQRLPHLLVAKRHVPTVQTVVNAVVHYHLANAFIGTGPRYNQYLAGCTFYGRRGPMAPVGLEVSKGNAKSAGYRLTVSDFAGIGRHCLKAGEVLGIYRKDRRVSDRIVSLYAQGVASGDCRGPVVLPYGSFPTTASGDHPLDHTFSKTCPVPSRFKGCNRRASGLIKGAWPEGLDISWEEREHLRCQPKPNPYTTRTTDSTPDVGWIFNQ